MSDNLKEKAEDVKEKVEDKAQEIKEKTKEKVEDAKEAVSEKAEDVKEGTKEKAEDTKEAVSEKAKGEVVDYHDRVIKKIINHELKDIDGLIAVKRSFLSNIKSKVINSNDDVSGVDIDVKKDKVTINLDIIVEYDKPIKKITENIKSKIFEKVNEMTELTVEEINIKVADIKTKEEYEAESVSIQDHVTNIAHGSGEFISEKIDKVKEAVGVGVNKVKEKAEDVKEGIKEKVEDVKEGTKENVEKLKEKAEDVKEGIKEKAEDVKEGTKENIEEIEELKKEIEKLKKEIEDNKEA